MRKLQALVGFLLLICAFGIEAKSPPPGTGKADVPANIYIMLDTSGSMGATVNQVGRMYYPRDVGVDSNGNMYIVEYYYHRIRNMTLPETLLRHLVATEVALDASTIQQE